ncbi:MAG: response regulator transcription factor [Candidatus Hydrogenedentes bacterium]|nr:response regulator transcription factor [Candidatus Hydrogenedentota bacterium]
MTKQRILVVEDDAPIRRGIADALEFDGYQILQAGNVADGRQIALDAAFDLLLLDLVLPDGQGLDILADLRRAKPTVPVIILTALGQEDDRVRGLKAGADDYVVKPFSVKELLARVEAVLRRSPARPGEFNVLRIAGVTIDFERREARLPGGARAELSDRELELLRYLAQHGGRAVSRDELLANVWRVDPRAILETRTIDMHVKRLREKLGDDAAHPALLLTVRGKGYMLARTRGAP